MQSLIESNILNNDLSISGKHVVQRKKERLSMHPLVYILFMTQERQKPVVLPPAFVF